ncbi:MAG: NAD(P)-dependent oxidoreductase [Candidatus Thiodiazotropha sp.]
MSTLRGKNLFITGGTRGIGLAIALRAAQDGANVAIAAKTDTPHPSLPGTLDTAVAEIEQAGGKAIGIKTDIRDDAQIAAAVQQTVERFGGIDILVNNASAINLTGTLETPMKRYDLMQQVNARGTFAVSQACLPYLLKADNPHILNLSPPLSMDPKWFKSHCAYTMAKYGMSLCVLGMAAEFRDRGVAINALWPKTVIYTAAIAMLEGLVKAENCRTADIVADAAHAIVTRDSRSCSGNFFIDEEVLREEGVSDFKPYAIDPNGQLLPDFFLD